MMKVVAAWKGLETYTRRTRRCSFADRDREMERLRAARLPEQGSWIGFGCQASLRHVLD
jgi:hypothetical protein